MRHLHVTQSMEPLRGGGLGIAAKDIHVAMLGNTIESRFLSTHSEPEKSIIPEGYLGKPVGGKKFFYSPQLKHKLEEWKDDFDVAHLHGFYVYPNWAVGSLSRKSGKPLICHPHGFFEPWILRRSRLIKASVHLLFETANFKSAKLWRALTTNEADQIRAQGIKAPIVVVANGVNLEDWENTISDQQPPKQKKRVLFLGRIHPKKGLPMLIDVWNSLGAQMKDWEIVIAGPDELKHCAELQTQINAHGLEKEISFIGTVTGGLKKAWLESADLFILPSHSEGFSVAILEGMTARVPTLASTACNFPELATDGGGWICEPNPDSLKKELAKAIQSSPLELKDRGVAARKLIEKQYTWSRIAQNLHEACEHYCK